MKSKIISCYEKDRIMGEINVMPNSMWSVITTQFNIPGNEEVVCCLGIGNLKKEYKVPRSYRLPYETIVSEIK